MLSFGSSNTPSRNTVLREEQETVQNLAHMERVKLLAGHLGAKDSKGDNFASCCSFAHMITKRQVCTHCLATLQTDANSNDFSSEPELMRTDMLQYTMEHCR